MGFLLQIDFKFCKKWRGTLPFFKCTRSLKRQDILRHWFHQNLYRLKEVFNFTILGSSIPWLFIIKFRNDKWFFTSVYQQRDLLAYTLMRSVAFPWYNDKRWTKLPYSSREVQYTFIFKWKYSFFVSSTPLLTCNFSLVFYILCLF
jgi:hypothetical protein